MLTIARAPHIAFVVLWIGGVAFVTTVLLPAVRHLKGPHERMELFDHIERRFASQARISTIIVGMTGFYMAYRFDLWDRFQRAGASTRQERLSSTAFDGVDRASSPLADNLDLCRLSALSGPV
jgi:uncharacterized membrane protein